MGAINIEERKYRHDHVLTNTVGFSGGENNTPNLCIDNHGVLDSIMVPKDIHIPISRTYQNVAMCCKRGFAHVTYCMDHKGRIF